jgi:hypothetical protein
MNIPAGIYRGKAIKGSEQYGNTSNGNEQIAIDLLIWNDASEGETRVTTFLFFTEKSAEFSIERLRALGWVGDDLTNLEGIDRNEVDVEVRHEMWEGKQRIKVNIMGSGGRVTLQNQMADSAKKKFAARYKNMAKTIAPKTPATTAPGGDDFPPDYYAKPTGTGGRPTF